MFLLDRNVSVEQYIFYKSKKRSNEYNAETVLDDPSLFPGNSCWHLEPSIGPKAGSELLVTVTVPLRIIILEDRPEDAELMVYELKKGGVDPVVTHVVKTQEEFVHALDMTSGDVDVILSDYWLQGFTGLDALAIAKVRCPDIPFIIVTGSINEITAVNCMKLGASDYVLKEHLIRLGPSVLEAFNKKQLTMEKRASDAALIASAQQWTETFDAIDDPICLIDMDHTILRCNKAMSGLVNQTPAGIVGKKCWEAIHQTSGPVKDCPVARMRQSLQREKLALPENGRVFNVTVDPVFDVGGKVRYAVHCISDITEVEKSRQAVLNSEHRYRDLYNQAPNAYFSIHPDNLVIISCNQKASSMLGYDISTLTGMMFSDLFVSNSSGNAGLQSGVLNGWEADPIHDVELQVCRADGTHIWVSLSTERVQDTSGDTVEIRAVLIDISRRKTLEVQLAQAVKMEAIGTLAGGIAHDFNNILASLIGFAELALEDVEPGSQLHDDLCEIHAAGKRGSDLARQILLFCRQGEHRQIPVQIGTLVKETLKMLRPSLPSSIRIQKNITSKAMVMADPSHLHQIIMNLCTNAYQSMPGEKGDLMIRVQDVSGPLTLPPNKTLLPLGDYVCIEVRDTGIGISPDVLPSIFEPYFTTKPQGEGTGLGLSVVHGVVSLIGGFIGVDSTPGSGTVFSVFLPVTKPHDMIELQEESDIRGGTERILVVDDESAILKMVSRILDSNGYRVKTLSSSRDALAMVTADPSGIDLLVTDMTMPDMTGDELACEIHQICPNLPIVLCTGYSKKLKSENLMSQGILEVITKPFSQTDLLSSVRRALDQCQQEEGLNNSQESRHVN